MKTVRRLCAVAALTFVFTHAAFADDGIIHGDSPKPTAPPDGADSAVATTSSSDDATLTDAAVEFVRVALNEMLALS
jgi:hypothetical protein